MNDYRTYLSSALEAAILAGKDILEVYSREFTVEQKEDKSPLTEADRKAHHRITTMLSRTGLPVLSEEGKEIPYSERSSWEYFWMVDPLDGTKEFIRRNGEFTVNIALIKKDTPVLGVIYAPVIDMLYFGYENGGAFRLEADFDYLMHLLQSQHIADRLIAAARKLPVNDDERKFTVVASRSHMSDDTERFINELKQRYGNIELLSKGSSLKLCLVAEGSADVYPRFAPTMEWDTAAGQAIVMAAGKKVINMDNGNAIIYNKENLLNPFFVAGR